MGSVASSNTLPVHTQTVRSIRVDTLVHAQAVRGISLDTLIDAKAISRVYQVVICQ